jgi:hypothetical protein
MSRTRLLLVGLLALAMLVSVPAATAKDFRPGDLRICSGDHCVKVTSRPVLTLLSSFYYSGHAPARMHSPRLGAPAFELRFDIGYVTGVVATAKLDRFLSYGVNLGRFLPERWYRVPARAARRLKRLAAKLPPLRVTPALVAKSLGKGGCSVWCP